MPFPVKAKTDVELPTGVPQVEGVIPLSLGVVDERIRGYVEEPTTSAELSGPRKIGVPEILASFVDGLSGDGGDYVR